MDPTGNRRRSVDAGIAAQSTQVPMLSRSRSFKTKQLVRSQAIRETQSPPRLPSPRPSTDACGRDVTVGNTLTDNKPSEVPVINLSEISLVDTSSQQDCDKYTPRNVSAPSDLHSSQEDVKKTTEHQVVIQVTSGEQCDLDDPCLQGDDAKYSTLTDASKPKLKSRKNHVGSEQTGILGEYDEAPMSPGDGRICICGSCNYADTERRRTQPPPCPSKQDSGVACCSEDCPDCFYWRSIDNSANDPESALSDKTERQKQWSSTSQDSNVRSSVDAGLISSKQDQKLQICSCQEKCDRNSSVKHRNISLMIQRTNSDECHFEPSGPDLGNFIKDTLNKNLKDRLTLLKIERELLLFISDPSRVRYQFPAMTSYGRMLVHRCAALFGLNHMVDNFTKTFVVVTKTASATYLRPCTPFKQWCLVAFPANANGSSQNIQHTDNFLQAKSILKRDSHSLDEPMGSGMIGGPSSGANGPPARSKSFEQREEEYERVRRRIFNAEERQSQDLVEWSWPAGSVKLLTPDTGARQARLLKVQSLERDGGRCANSAVSKSHSFGGYGAPPAGAGTALTVASFQPRLLSRQGDLASSSWRLSPSSSGYKTLSFRSTDSVTPSPTGNESCDHTPEPVPEASLNCSVPPSSDSTGAPSLVWAVSDITAIPNGALILHPQTGRPVMNPDGSLYKYDPSKPPNLGDVDASSKSSTPPAVVKQNEREPTSPEVRRGRLAKQKSINACNECQTAGCAENTERPCGVSAEVLCTCCECQTPKRTARDKDELPYGVAERSMSPLGGSASKSHKKSGPSQQEGSSTVKDIKTTFTKVKEAIVDNRSIYDRESFFGDCECCRQESCSIGEGNTRDRERTPHLEEPRENDTNLPLLSIPQLPRPSDQVYGLSSELQQVLKQTMLLANPEQYQIGPHTPASFASCCPPHSPTYSTPPPAISHMPPLQYQYCDEQSLAFTYGSAPHQQRSQPVHYPVETVTPTASPLVRGISQPVSAAYYQGLNPYHQANLWPGVWPLGGSMTPSGSTATLPSTPLYGTLPPQTQAHHMGKTHSPYGLYIPQSDYGLLPNPYTVVPSSQQLYQTTPSLMPMPYAAAHSYAPHVLAATQHYGLYPGYSAYSQNIMAAASIAQTERSPAPLPTYEQNPLQNAPVNYARREYEHAVIDLTRSVSDENRPKQNPSNSGSIPNTPRTTQSSPQSPYPFQHTQHFFPSQDSYQRTHNYFQFPAVAKIPEYPATGVGGDALGLDVDNAKWSDKQTNMATEECTSCAESTEITSNIAGQGHFFNQQGVQNQSAEKSPENAAETHYPSKEECLARDIASNLNAESKNFVPKSPPSESPQSEAAREIIRNINRIQDKQSNSKANAPHNGQNSRSRVNSKPFDKKHDFQFRNNKTNAANHHAQSPVSALPNMAVNQSSFVSKSGSPKSDVSARPAQSPSGRPKCAVPDYPARNNMPNQRQGLIPFNPRVFGNAVGSYPPVQYNSNFRPRAPPLVAQHMQAMGMNPFIRQVYERHASGDSIQGPNSQIYRPRGPRFDPSNPPGGPRIQSQQYGRQNSNSQRR